MKIVQMTLFLWPFFLMSTKATASHQAQGQLSCNICTNTGVCTNEPLLATHLQINLGQNISPSECQGQCQTRMQNIGWTEGCWIIALDGNCYCRNGDLDLHPSSVCTDSADSTQISSPGGICSLGNRVCTEINDDCATNAPWCNFLTDCKSNCQTIDLVTYSCPDKCRKCSGSQACKDAETWCGFVKNSALCSTYEIGIKICPKSCQKCEDCQFIRRNNGCGLVNGGLGNWGAWTQCVNGRKTRTRICNNPTPSTCGNGCPSSPIQTSACSNTEICRNIKIRTESWGHENSYVIGSCSSKRQYSNNQNYEEQCCLAPGNFNLECKCSYGDGWHGGYLEINGVRYCKDFTSGAKKTVTVQWNPNP